jgi:hypothetical protein
MIIIKTRQVQHKSNNDKGRNVRLKKYIILRVS